jgi:hypothetical protein
LLTIFQLRAVLGRQSFSPGIPTSQIEIIGVPCPVIKKSMLRSKNFLCPHCENGFATKIYLKHHIKEKHKDHFESTDFKKISRQNNEDSLKKVKYFQCSHCVKRFKQKQNLKFHISRKHKEEFKTADFSQIKAKEFNANIKTTNPLNKMKYFKCLYLRGRNTWAETLTPQNCP